MDIKNVVNKLFKKIKENSDVIMTAVGVVGCVVGSLAMKKASVKATSILDGRTKTKKDIEDIAEWAKASDEAGLGRDFYTEEREILDVVVNEYNTVKSLVRNYFLPVVICIVSGCILVTGIYSYMYKEYYIDHNLENGGVICEKYI